MKTVQRFIFPLIVAAQIFSAAAAGQETSQAEVSRLLTEADARRLEYVKLFKNLSADETKLVESFDYSGTLTKRREIQSELIVYESPKNADFLREYRSVKQVDGKIIKDSEDRVVKLFEKIGNDTSFTEALKQIEKESQRYDKEYTTGGLTLFPAVVLTENLRKSFEFKVLGEEKLSDGSDTIVVGFQQIASNEDINVQIEAIDYLELSPTFYRGKIWIDAKNKKLRKLTQELMVNSPRVNQPILLSREKFEYQPSTYDIYLPSKISLENYQIENVKAAKLLLRNKGKVDLPTFLTIRLTFKYKNFQKFNVNVKLNLNDSQN